MKKRKLRKQLKEVTKQQKRDFKELCSVISDRVTLAKDLEKIASRIKSLGIEDAQLLDLIAPYDRAQTLADSLKKMMQAITTGSLKI